MNDIVVAIDDKTKAMTESDFLAYLRLNHGPQDSVQLTVLRNGHRQELVIPMW
jgi:S1-C subfamily serine protease